ncbi:MAG: polysaccharide export protein [Chthoniobacterales bacterium]|nr:polysaccharide export protein [Chthoniobacterales bacterium]
MAQDSGSSDVLLRPAPKPVTTPAAAAVSTPAAAVPAVAPAPVVPAAPAPASSAASSGGGGALSSGESDYVLVVGDVIELNIFREPDLATQATIARDGTVQLPLVREVKLAGLTIREAREMLRGLYDREYLVNPQVFLNVVRYAQRKFTIMGQVARPGSYELQGGERIDILEAIGLAGGFTRIANRGRVIIQRKEGGSVIAIKANAKRMADGKEEPVEVQPGDVITVTESWF